MAHRLLFPLAAFPLLAILSACDGITSTAALTTSPPPGSDGPREAMDLRCTVSTSAATLVCESPARAARGDLILGGQGVRVKLTSSNVSVDPATSTLQADVTVQNLLSQPIGTPDGTTVSGVKVFFHQLPTITKGSGTVIVQNPGGFGTFTAANQPYFFYNQILAPQATSAAKTWKFTVPATATTFVFSVYVAAALPMETGVLRWVNEQARGTYARAVWGTSDSSLFAVGSHLVTYWNGHTWTQLLASPNTDPSFAHISGTSERDVWVLTATELLHYGGNSWTRYPAGDGERLGGVWAATPNLAFAVGNDWVMRRWNGSGWSREPLPVPASSATDLHAVWGSSPSDVWAAGENGLVLHYDGTGWTQVHTGSTSDVFAIWGSSSTDVWMVGEFGQIVHYDGSSWTLMPPLTSSRLLSVWGSGPNEVYAVGGPGPAIVLRWDGSTWTRLPVDDEGLEGVWGTADGYFVAVGVPHDLHKAPGGNWTVVLDHPYLVSVNAVSAGDVYAVLGQQVQHWNGSAWSILFSAAQGDQHIDAAYDGAGTLYIVGSRYEFVPLEYGYWTVYYGTLTKVVNGVPGTAQAITSEYPLTNVWAAPGSNVFAVAVPSIEIRGPVQFLRSQDGGPFEWLQPCKTGIDFSDVWGSSHHDVFVVGDSGTICHFDGSVKSMQSGTTANLTAVHGTGPNDVWAVGEGGTMLHYGGSTWTRVPTPTTADLYGVWAAPDGAVYVTSGQGVMQYANGAWGSYPGTSGVRGLDGVSANEMYAFGSGLILHGQR